MGYADIYRPVEAKILLNNLRHNLTQLKSKKPDAGIMAVVKANAYGHGSLEIAGTAIDWGCKRLAVAIMSEAVFLRQNGISVPIVVFYQPLPEEVETAVNWNFELSVHSFEAVEYIEDTARKHNRKIKVHVKADTGMGRGGVAWEKAGRLISIIEKSKYLDLTGFYTHFATSDSADKKYAGKQLDRFKKLAELVRKSSSASTIIHAANSGAILSMDGTGFDTVRPGVSMYGYYPSDELKQDVDLKPVMNLMGRITQIKEMPGRHSLGYSRTYFTKSATRTAIVPVGYADGYDRGLSNFGEVFIKGRKFQVSGRVSMDSIIIDLKDNDDINIGDNVLLLGEENGCRIDIWRICRHLKTIPYVVTCNISARVPRTYFNN